MTWGHELWDCYDKVSSHVSSGVNSNLQSYSKFFKEKVEIEREYAKSLRKLVNKFAPRRESEENGEQYEEEMVFSSILTETGYIAGQHEMIAENIQHNIVKELQTKSAESINKIKINIKSHKREKEKIKTSYLNLEKQKLKYLKSFQDWEDSDKSCKDAEKDGKLARNEILRMKLESESKHSYYDHQTETYQNQLKTTNTDQSNYFCVLLPSLIERLETVERDRLTVVKNVFKLFISTERDLQNIINKCRNDMESVVNGLDVEKDINLVLNINKSGDVPPCDIPYVLIEELRQRKSSSLTRRLTLSHAGKNNKQATSKQNLFQKKRKLLMSIEKCKADYERGSKEAQALQLMIDTYKQTPEFGDGKKFEQELKIVTERVARLEQELSSLNHQLDLVESAMCLNIRNSLISSAMDSVSETSDYTSSNSIDDNLESGEEEWEDQEEKEVRGVRKLLALYSYSGEEDGSIKMELGEELEVLEEDVEGWSRVRRSEGGEEGFIPTSFTSPITDS